MAIAGQFRQRAQDADFLVGKIVRPARINIQRADGLAGEKQRHAQQRNQPFAPRDLDVLITA